MKYAHIQQNNFVAAQVLRLSDDNYIMARAYVQPNGSLGAYSQETGDERWNGRTYPTEQASREAQLEPFAEYMEYAEQQNAFIEQERSDRFANALALLQGDQNLPKITALQNKIQQAIEERDRLLKEAGYEKMSYDDSDHSWWGRKDLGFQMEDQMPPGSSFPAY